MIPDAQMHIATDFSIVGVGFPTTVGSTIDLLNIGADIRDLVMVLQCTEKPVVGSGTPAISFNAVLGDDATLSNLASLVQVGCSPFLAGPAAFAQHLNGLVPEVGSLIYVPLGGDAGFVRGASLGGPGVGLGIDPGEMYATLGRRFLGVRCTNIVLSLTGASSYTAGKFSVWFTNRGSIDTGPRTYPRGFSFA